MKKSSLALFLLFALGLSLYAQDSVTRSSALPKTDGVVTAGEYQYTKTVSGMSIGVTLGNDDLLYLSIVAPTTGWVALGVGGRVMDGSRLFLAYDSEGKKFFTEQLGSGHSHSDAPPVAKKWAVLNADGSTTFELVLPASLAMVGGNLDVLASYGATTAFVHHVARTSFALAVKN
jgi:hypothetical protein